MTSYILCYETFTLFETVLVSYMFNSEESNEKAVMVGFNGRSVKSYEGIIVQPDLVIEEIDFKENDLFIIPGGNYTKIPENQYMKMLLNEIFEKKYKIAAICSGVNYLKEQGYLKEYNSILSNTNDLVEDKNLITCRANAFVDFAIELANNFNILGDEEGYLETVRFFKNQKI